jgi:ribosomal protein S12 methylthiotransferase accessory factor
MRHHVAARRDVRQRVADVVRSQAERMSLAVQIVERRSRLDRIPENGQLILVLLEPGLLAVVPAGARPRELFLHLLTFSDGLADFSAFERRWSWSSLLASQLANAITACAELLSRTAGPSAPVYVYLNGTFHRKFYPGPLAADCDITGGCTRAGDDCRGELLFPHDILRVFGTDSAQNCSTGLAADQRSAYCYNSRLDIVGIGRGRTEQEMLLGAALELAERWVATRHPGSAVRAAHSALGSVALQPHEVWGIPEAAGHGVFPGFDADVAIDWLPCRVEPRGQDRWLPLDLVNYLRDSPHAITEHRNSNGCALGNSPAEAALFAALEVIERDALLLTWYSGCAPPRFDVASIDHPPIIELVRLLTLRGYHIALFDMTSELGVPTVLALLRGAREEQLATFTTAASHPSPVQAAWLAIAEAHSLISAAERNHERARQRSGQQRALFLEDHAPTVQQYLLHADARHLEQFEFLLRSPPTLDFAAFVAAHPFSNPAPARALDELLARLEALDYQMIICDNTPAPLRALQLCSARVYIPGTINLTFGASTVEHIPPDRFRKAARHLPWMDAGTTPRHCMPHPLG